MEKFVRRGGPPDGADAAPSPPARTKRRQRQTTIDVGGKVVVEEMVFHLKEELDAAKTAEDMLRVLEALEQLFISLEMLEKTLIGRALTRLHRRAPTEQIETKTLQLLKTWKSRAKKAVRRRERRVQTFGRNFAE